MEGEREMRKPIDLDWEKLLPSRDDEPTPVLVVTPAAKQRSATCDEQSANAPKDDLERYEDKELNEMIYRQKRTLENLGPRLPDKGSKLRATIQRLEDEKERRKLRRVEKDCDGCETQTPEQSKNPGASDGARQEVSRSSLPQSSFASHFCKKMEDEKECSTVNAFEKELSTLSRCDRRKTRNNGQFSTRLKLKNGSSSRLSSCSPHHSDGKLFGPFFEKRKSFQVLPANDLRRRNGQTVVLVDEEEPELIEMMEQEDKVDDCMKETKIYYPSRDDPESVEICFSDMECLAPEAYVSSSIMNFYIQYLQQPTSSNDRERCDYHFFNTYFYKKLKEAVSSKGSGMETSFNKFRRWWKGVDIFRKAYILLPIHENLHWSLVIICFPDEEDESGPIILHLDSLGLHSSRFIFDNIKSFLIEEWNYLNQGKSPQDLPIAERIWKHLSRRIEGKTIAVPQQRNEYDCGLFVLFFMERFIEEAPERLKRKDLAMFGNKWFEPEEASGLRRKIRKLLMKEFRKACKDQCVLDHKSLSSGSSPLERIEHCID